MTESKSQTSTDVQSECAVFCVGDYVEVQCALRGYSGFWPAVISHVIIPIDQTPTRYLVKWAHGHRDTLSRTYTQVVTRRTICVQACCCICCDCTHIAASVMYVWSEASNVTKVACLCKHTHYEAITLSCSPESDQSND